MRSVADCGWRDRICRVLRAAWPRFVLSLVLLAALEGMRSLGGTSWYPAGAVGRWVLVVVLLEAAEWAGSGKGKRLLVVVSLLVLATVGYLLTSSTSAAWVASMVLYVWVGAVARAARVRGLGRWALTFAILCTAGGLTPVLLSQIESRFSDEEFFVALEAGLLMAWTALFISGQRWLAYLENGPSTLTEPDQMSRWHSLSPAVSLSAAVCAIIGAASICAYRRSLFPNTAPSYPGISRGSPFVCGRVEPDPESPSGMETFERLLDRVEAQQHLQTPDYGFLALATQDREWAELFREAVLRDAQEGRYTGPAHSVKYGQHLAARRIWYLQNVMKAFPDLFTSTEVDALWAWTEAVNRRALTVEWVDWAYGLALSYRPAGPYENQDHGLGLLALLEGREGIIGAFSIRNREYLASNQRGWTKAFRNTDDAYIYQPEWIENALFQLAYYGADGQSVPAHSSNQRLSFEWLLAQTLPDGAPLAYNHPTSSLLAGTAYLGATLLDDPRYVWWSSRLLDWAESTDIALSAQPGLREPTTISGISPVEGSCLIYGDSGLPARMGPLAPDKIVFRDGWTAESQYLLLNLRFSGWHRYKATNAVVVVYQGGPLVVEPALRGRFPWLPEGRTLLRDKRVPREELNGLLVPRRGLSAVLFGLTGFGSPWAQDPPYYARVERFETLAGLDMSRTTVEEWNGWSHARSVYFFHAGPIVIVDEASSDSVVATDPAIRWHLVGEGRAESPSLWLRQGTDPARVAWGQEAWPDMTFEPMSDYLSQEPLVQVTYRPSVRGSGLRLATTWLLGNWADSQHEASVLYDPSSDAVVGHSVRVSGKAGRIELLHNADGNRLEANGLITDGQAMSVRWAQDGQAALICVVGGSYSAVALAHSPSEVSLASGDGLEHEVWSWQDGRLVLRPAGGSLCLEVR